jgi:predicted AAA+ superfamily ATPase
MKRLASDELSRWFVSHTRKPLVVRGARQVGKTWLVRDFAKARGLDLVEINFEQNPPAARWFASNSPKQILDELSLALHRDIEPGKSLLFLDEIQAGRGLLATLRWFAEQLPALAVVAAGSLLDFALADSAVRVPVGRASYLHLEPLGFPEFLRAHGQHRLLGALSSWLPSDELSLAGHEAAGSWFHRFSMVGGMPAVVMADTERGDPRECRQLQTDLMNTYRDDFARYAGRMDPLILDHVLLAVTSMLGRKFVATRVGEGVKQHQASRALELLTQARLCHVVMHSAANGIPLGGEVNSRLRKVLLLDVGMAHALLGTPAEPAYPKSASLAPQVRAQLADQVVGQELRLAQAQPGREARIFYWQREGGRAGELDFVLQCGDRIVPVELKAGSAGAMKSLHQFMFDKELTLAVRLDTNPPSLQHMAVKTTKGQPVRYRLLNLPHYLAWRVGELVDQQVGS